MANVSPDSIETLNRAIRQIGSQTAFSKLLGVSQMAVSRWSRGITALPAEHVLAIESATGISCHDLRPDLYPRADNAASASAHLEAAR